MADEKQEPKLKLRVNFRSIRSREELTSLITGEAVRVEHRESGGMVYECREGDIIYFLGIVTKSGKNVIYCDAIREGIGESDIIINKDTGVLSFIKVIERREYDYQDKERSEKDKLLIGAGF